MICQFTPIGGGVQQCKWCGQKARSTRPRIVTVAECSYNVTLRLGDWTEKVIGRLGISKDRAARWKLLTLRWLGYSGKVNKCKCGKRQQSANEWGRWLEGWLVWIRTELLKWAR